MKIEGIDGIPRISQTIQYLTELGSKDAALHARVIHKNAEVLRVLRDKPVLSEDDKLTRLWIFGGWPHGHEMHGSIKTICMHVSFGKLKWFYSKNPKDASVYLYLQDELKAGAYIETSYLEVGYAIYG